MQDSTILTLNDDIVEVCIEIRKNHKTKLPDAIIAATAIVYDLVIITRNTSDFSKIKDIQVLNPHHL